MHRSSGVQDSRSSHQLHAAQREKTFALEGWVACPGDAAAPPFHKTLPVYRTHSNQCGGGANLEEANLERATIDLVIGPAAMYLSGARPATTILNQGQRSAKRWYNQGII